MLSDDIIPKKSEKFKSVPIPHLYRITLFIMRGGGDFVVEVI